MEEVVSTKLFCLEKRQFDFSSEIKKKKGACKPND